MSNEHNDTEQHPIEASVTTVSPEDYGRLQAMENPHPDDFSVRADENITKEMPEGFKYEDEEPTQASVEGVDWNGDDSDGSDDNIDMVRAHAEFGNDVHVTDFNYTSEELIGSIEEIGKTLSMEPGSLVNIGKVNERCQAYSVALEALRFVRAHEAKSPAPITMATAKLETPSEAPEASEYSLIEKSFLNDLANSVVKTEVAIPDIVKMLSGMQAQLTQNRADQEELAGLLTNAIKMQVSLVGGIKGIEAKVNSLPAHTESLSTIVGDIGGLADEIAGVKNQIRNL